MSGHQMVKRYSEPPRKIAPILTAEEASFSERVQEVVKNLVDGPLTSRKMIPYQKWKEQRPKEILIPLSLGSLRSESPSYIMSDVVRKSLLAILALGVCVTVMAAFMTGATIPTGILATLKSGGTYFISF